jgi:diacylglycerol kinase family enzyme
MDGRDDVGVRPSERPSVGRRLAAAGALCALLAAVGIVIGSLLNAPGRMLAVLLLTVGAVVAAWTALVHRGARRVVAAVVAGCAVLGIVALLVSGSVGRLVLLVGLMAVSTAASRVALGRAPDRAGARSVGPARHGVLLMNPWSGGGKVGRFDLVGEAHRRGITPIVLDRGDDLRALAEGAVADGADVIGMAGGDGSQALVADVARRHDVPFVCVPAGTRNHFALDLGLDRADVPAALDAYGPAVERRVDLAEVGGRIFVNNASIGTYATVVQADEYRDAKLATTARLLPDLLGPGGRRVDLHFVGGDGDAAPPADVVLVSNDAYRLDRISGFGRRERLDAGTLGIVTVTVDRARDVPALMAAEAAGRVTQFPGYREWTAPQFEVGSGESLIDVGVDGEALRLPPPLRFRSLPGALRVRTPVDTPGGRVTTGSLGAARAVAALLGVLISHPTPPSPAIGSAGTIPSG